MGEAGATTVRSMINSCGLCTSSCRRDADARHLANKYAAILDRLMRDQVSPEDLRAQGGRCVVGSGRFRSASIPCGSVWLSRGQRGGEAAGGSDNSQPNIFHMSGLRPSHEGSAERGDDSAVTINHRRSEGVNAGRIFSLVLRPALTPY